MSLVFFAFGLVRVIAFELVAVNSPYYDQMLVIGNQLLIRIS